MTKPWVTVTAGVAGLLVIGMAVKHFGTSSDEPTALRAGPSASGAAGGGFSARTVPDSGIDGPSKTGAMKGRLSAGVGGDRARRGNDTPESQGADRNRYSGGATVGGGPARGRGMGGGPAGLATGGDKLQAGPAAVGSSGLPFDTAKRLGDRLPHEVAAAQAGTELAKSTGDPNDPNDPNRDPNEPVLELFDKTAPPDTGNTSPVIDSGLAYNSGEGAKFSLDSQFAVPDAGHVKGESGTISFQIQPEWQGNDDTDAALVQLSVPNRWENRIEIGKNGPFLRFLLFDNTMMENGTGARIDNWQPGESHQITATWNEDPENGNWLALYVDGQLAGRAPYDGKLEVPSDRPLYIGNNFIGNNGARGTISDFKVYNRPLDPNEVAVHAGGTR